MLLLYRLAHVIGYRAIGAYFQISATTAHSNTWQVICKVVQHRALFVYLTPPRMFSAIAEVFAAKTLRVDIMGAMDGS